MSLHNPGGMGFGLGGKEIGEGGVRYSGCDGGKYGLNPQSEQSDPKLQMFIVNDP